MIRGCVYGARQLIEDLVDGVPAHDQLADELEATFARDRYTFGDGDLPWALAAAWLVDPVSVQRGLF
jgi:hypothetical protein